MQKNDQRVPFFFNAYIAKKASLVKGAQGIASTFGIDTITNFNRQVVEDRAGGNPLQPFQLDILDDERLGCDCGG